MNTNDNVKKIQKTSKRHQFSKKDIDYRNENKRQRQKPSVSLLDYLIKIWKNEDD